MPFKRKREFAGGNPFVSRKKYKGTMFDLSKGRSLYKPTLTAVERKAAYRRSRRMVRRRGYTMKSVSAAKRLKKTFGKKKASTIMRAVKEAQQDQNVSTYRKQLFGDFNPCWYYNAGTSSAGVGIGKKHFFSHFKKQTNASPFTQYACEFTAFTPTKLMDACSVLYGGKTAAANHELTTGNMANSTIAHFIYASQHFEMINFTGRMYDIRIYELHSTAGQHSTPPLFDVDGSISSHLWVSAPVRTLAAGNGELVIDSAFELSDLKMKNWKVAKVQKLNGFKPGQRYSWSTSFKHKTINFEKLATTANQLGTYGPGTVHYIIEAQLSKQLVYTATAAETTYGLINPTNDASQSFGFNTHQVYKIAEPENVDDANEGVKTALFTDASMGPAVTFTGTTERFTRMANYESYSTAAV